MVVQEFIGIWEPVWVFQKWLLLNIWKICLLLFSYLKNDNFSVVNTEINELSYFRYDSMYIHRLLMKYIRMTQSGPNINVEQTNTLLRFHPTVSKKRTIVYHVLNFLGSKPIYVVKINQKCIEVQFSELGAQMYQEHCKAWEKKMKFRRFFVSVLLINNLLTISRAQIFLL